MLKFYIEEEKSKINQIKYNYKDSIKNRYKQFRKTFESKIKKIIIF